MADLFLFYWICYAHRCHHSLTSRPTFMESAGDDVLFANLDKHPFGTAGFFQIVLSDINHLCWRWLSLISIYCHLIPNMSYQAFELVKQHILIKYHGGCGSPIPDDVFILTDGDYISHMLWDFG